MEPKLSAKAHT